MALASMGIYVFNTAFLMDELRRDAADKNSSRDFGKDIIPHIVKNGKAVAHRFAKSCVRSSQEREAYWRDVGTIDAYWEANIDLTDVTPELDIYDRDWPIGPMPRSSRRQSSCTTSTAGGEPRCPRWWRATASSPAAR